MTRSHPAPLTATENPWVRMAARARRSVAVKAAGMGACRLPLCDVWIGSRTGVAVVGRPSGRAFIAAIGLALLARDAQRLYRARGVVRTYRSGWCPL